MFVWPPGRARTARWPWNLRLGQRGLLDDSEPDPWARHPRINRGLGFYLEELSNGFWHDRPTRTPDDLLAWHRDSARPPAQLAGEAISGPSLGPEGYIADN
jgi:hypothetical protein